MDTLVQDLKLALRSLRRAPNYTLAALVALALAIGANTTLFSLIDAVLLKPFPYPHPEQILMVRESTHTFTESSVSLPNYLDWREQTKSEFSAMAAGRRDSFNLIGSGDPERVSGREVGAEFFDILAAKPQLGRTFTESDDQPGAARTVILSNSLWQRRFASDPRVIGQSIQLTGASYTIIGVMPPSFRFLSPTDLYVPIRLWSDQFKNRDSHPGISVIARLKDGVTLEHAVAALNAVAKRLEQEYPRSNAGHGVTAKSIQDYETEDYRTALYVLWGAVALVLLIASANVANLSLARAAARGPELAIRAALGAGRGRLMRELLTESVLLSLAGGVLGVLLSLVGLDALLPIIPEGLRRNAEIKIDGGVLAFTIALAVITGLIFGALPALRASRPDTDSLLRDAHSTDSRSRRRLRGALVIFEMALSLMLLIGAGLLLRSFGNLTNIDRGFDPRGVLTLQLTLPEQRYVDGESEIRFEQLLRQRLGALPGVKSVAVSDTAPLFDDNSVGGFWVEGRERPKPGEGFDSMNYGGTEGFLRTLGGRLLRGRDLRDDDDLRHPALLIDDALAKKLFGSEDPLGKRIFFPPENVGQTYGLEVVGIYAHMTHFDTDATGSITTGMILPYSLTAQIAPQWRRGLLLLLRTDGDPDALAVSVRREVQSIDGELPVYSVKSMLAAFDEQLASRKFSLILLALFAGAALLLAAVGVYGVMSYGVVQRTKEIGIRMALGARQQDVLRLVVGDGLRLAGGGIVFGLALAVGLSRVLRSMLFGVSAFDPLSYFGLTLALGLIALLAAWLPARRAAKVDPNVALHAE